ncbi:putative thymidylate kinase [Diachasmimorpha longicaudata entomopoxvirus]|uniref:Thymidylate kinase n=1 Tax=Diachasmimorpha longicaudata entomopoxvirus TaxID=109981 RepID=A0A7R5WUH1_9POXV|nr:putative thymidylate kinase [Diachasmimorpha longicaudata entomopoxvirus]AKS26467.1 putative thymidylate kinase [Diachasmimorpha longicaudata entomopoxvirus]
MATIPRGSLIVFEGCDGVGKSTQAQLLVDRLNKEGKKAELLRFPDRTTQIGNLIDQVLQKKIEMPPTALALLFSANRWEWKEYMTQALYEETILVVDRYVASGIAYATAVDPEHFILYQMIDSGLLKPDLVIFLNNDRYQINFQGNKNQEFFEKSDIQQKVSTVFNSIAEPDFWHFIDPQQPISVIHDEIFSKVTDVLNISACLPIFTIPMPEKYINI